MPLEGVEQFNAEAERWAKELVPGQFLKLLRYMVLAVLSGVVEKTPVKTGRAKGGWLVEIGSFSDAERISEDPSGAETLGAGLAVIEQIDTYEIVYVSNSVVYIVPLEEGHSKQAPQGMLAITLEEVALLVQSQLDSGSFEGPEA